jgi:hypothetical protein
MSTTLSASQQQVLALIATGSTAPAAAAAAGVHRNTISNWLRLPAFHQAILQAEYDRAVSFREQAAAMAADAYAAVRSLLADPATPAGVRLKAALAIIDRANACLPDQPKASAAEIQENVHNFAQSAPPDQTKSAPDAAKTGRNVLCPCGSGVKFKRCCLGKPLQPAAPLAAAATGASA